MAGLCEGGNEPPGSLKASKRMNLLKGNKQELSHHCDHLSVPTPLQPSLFPRHKSLFPKTEFKLAIELFHLNAMELRQELTVIYGRNDFANASGALTLLSCIYENNLELLLPELVKLLRIICMISMTTSECYKCFSALKRIKTFIKNTMKEDGLSGLAMCSIEKTLLSIPDFNEHVSNHFAEQKERRMDFIYKQIN
ncbi:hypothetical protein ANN_26238 [Periplaneta americana]|uniref:HAT C-terminal dimerisation domain-containing protein n=1 Tax=Periplaneta americana TaxID=6978 RepID=A0ABQ8S5Q0_PERAM|nr:hypothetical protein ANN_26238 [Periplaneta americana]